MKNNASVLIVIARVYLSTTNYLSHFSIGAIPVFFVKVEVRASLQSHVIAIESQIKRPVAGRHAALQLGCIILEHKAFEHLHEAALLCV